MDSSNKRLTYIVLNHVNRIHGREIAAKLDLRSMPEEFLRLWRETVAECELEFERQIANFPYEVHLPLVEELYDGAANEAMLAYCEYVVNYLKDNFKVGTYIVFPNSAAGKYIDKANSVFFAASSDAILFKLSM